MKQMALIPFSFLLLSACVMGYKPVGPDTQVIGNLYSVEPQITWSSIEQDKRQVWTVDGPALEQVLFVTGLEEGETLVSLPIGDDRELPRFRAAMAPSEVVEFIIDTVSTTRGTQAQARSLEPFEFGSARGFRCDFDFLTRDGLEMDGLAAGAVVNDRLYLIVYTGTRQHYFPRYRPAVEKIIESVRMI